MGCHSTRISANRQLAALNANENKGGVKQTVTPEQIQALTGVIRSLVTGGLNLSDSERHAAINKAIEKGLYRRKVSLEAKAIDDDNFSMDFVITRRVVDRDSELVLPRSFEKHLQVYLDNPVVLFAHDHKIPAVAQMTAHKITDEEFSVTDQFAAKESDFSALLWRLYSKGFMRAVSVGFLPLKWSSRPQDKLEAQQGRTFQLSEKLEHSLVNIPSNREALAKAYKSPEIDPFFHKFIEALIEIPETQKCGHMTCYDIHGEALTPCPVCDGNVAMVSRAVTHAMGSNHQIAEKYRAQLAQRGIALPTTEKADEPNADKIEQLLMLWDDDVETLMIGDNVSQGSYTIVRLPDAKDELNGGVVSHQSAQFERTSDEIEKFFGVFTFPGTYERMQRDIRMSLPDLKVVLGLRDWDNLFLRGTTDTMVICFADDFDLWYVADYQIDENEVVTFSNVQQVEITIGDAIGTALQPSTTSVDNQIPTEPVTPSEVQPSVVVPPEIPIVSLADLTSEIRETVQSLTAT